jgi:hypothetical protein
MNSLISGAWSEWVVVYAVDLSMVVCTDLIMTSASDDASKPTIEDYAPGSRENPYETKTVGIVNGQDASPGEYPWAVYAGGRGGTLISDRWVTTAAHCSAELQIGDFVNIGGLRFSLRVHGNNRQWRQIVSRSCHPDYRSSSENFDLHVVEFGSVPTVAIDRSQSTYTGTNAVAAGGGNLRQGGESPHIFQESIVPVSNENTCEQPYRNLTGNRIRAGYLHSGIDGCQGDSGGPSVSLVNGELIGVVSFSRGYTQQTPQASAHKSMQSTSGSATSPPTVLTGAYKRQPVVVRLLPHGQPTRLPNRATWETATATAAPTTPSSDALMPVIVVRRPELQARLPVGPMGMTASNRPRLAAVQPRGRSTLVMATATATRPTTTRPARGMAATAVTIPSKMRSTPATQTDTKPWTPSTKYLLNA